MKTRMIHENLDTSFVNVSAMIGYLRRRQFVGNIRIKSSGYEAEVFLLENNQVKAREHDRITGNQTEGEEALHRILQRTREPGGIINVFQTVNATREKLPPTPENHLPPTQDKHFSAAAGDFPKSFPQVEINGNGEKTSGVKPLPKPKFSLPDFPFDLSNCVENKAQRKNLPLEDWKTLMQLTAEIFVETERILAESRIDFAALLKKTASEIAQDYPFLNPSAEIFDYQNGRLIVREQVNAKFFIAGINEILRRILQKLSRNPKFSDIHRRISQKLLALVHHRRPIYARFHITPQLEKILGV